MSYEFDMEIKAGENIFAALGFEKEEAEQLQAESERRIAAKEDAKRKLASGITNWIVEGKFTQQQAATQLGVSRPRVSDLMRERLGKFSMDSLLGVAVRTGKQVDLVLR